MSTYADENKNVIRDFSYGMPTNKDCFDLEELQAHLTEHPEIFWVSFPRTWTGYGTTFVDLANYEYLNTYYAGMLTEIQNELFVPANGILNANNDDELFDLMELFFMVKNEYPAIEDSIVSRMESEAIEEFIFQEIRFELELDDDQIIDALQLAEIDFYEYASIDNDGYAVYMSKSDSELLMTKLKEVI